MRRLIKKWGEAALAALCVLAIVFAALYTRQDDLRRLAARDAAASRDERLEDVREPSGFQPPIAQRESAGFSGAARTSGGLWQFSPYADYTAAYGQSICAMGAGTVTQAAGDSVWIDHGGGIRTGYRLLQTLRVIPGQAVEAGQAIGTAGSGGQVQVCALRDGAYIDPQALIQ
ncbi:MAG: M23 family metallopeptidase [Clostridia bacterium]|nr:M23 family metallopeptidase [Clostridia bacterium]